MRWCVVLLAGCGRIGFDSGDGGQTGDGHGTGDGTVKLDGLAAGCPDPGDLFPGGIPCAGWGTPIFSNASLSESNGTLSVTPNANTPGAKGGCSHAVSAFTATGVVLEVSAITSGATTFLSITDTASSTAFSFQTAGGILLSMVEPGQMTIPAVTYDSIAMRWWRMRPSGAQVEFETSPDGMSWTHRYTSVFHTAPSTITLELGATTAGAIMTPGVAAFNFASVCPP